MQALHSRHILCACHCAVGCPRTQADATEAGVDAGAAQQAHHAPRHARHLKRKQLLMQALHSSPPKGRPSSCTTS